MCTAPAYLGSERRAVMAMSAGLCVESLTGTMISGHRRARRVTAEAKPTIPHSKGSWMSRPNNAFL